MQNLHQLNRIAKTLKTVLKEPHYDCHFFAIIAVVVLLKENTLIVGMHVQLQGHMQ